MPLNIVAARALAGRKRAALPGNAGKRARAQYKAGRPGSERKSGAPLVVSFENSTFGMTPAEAMIEGLREGKSGREINFDAGTAGIKRILNTSRLRASNRGFERRLGLAAKVMERFSQTVPRADTLTAEKYRGKRGQWMGMQFTNGNRTVYIDTFSIPRENEGRRPDLVIRVSDAKPKGVPFLPYRPGELITERGWRLESIPHSRLPKDTKIYEVLGWVLLADILKGKGSISHAIYYLKERQK